jgi:hypothetical protein
MSTSFPPFIHMFSTARFRVPFCVLLLSALASVARAQGGDATLYRVFLNDGSTVVSYGEFARVGDRVVVSLPLGGSDSSPELQLLSLPADAVDWDKTDAYAESARAARYAQTRGPEEFALLNEAVSRALTDIALTPDPQRKIAMATEARQNVTKWAAEHFAYRAKNVAELAGLFDAVIAEARSAAGISSPTWPSRRRCPCCRCRRSRRASNRRFVRHRWLPTPRSGPRCSMRSKRRSHRPARVLRGPVRCVSASPRRWHRRPAPIAPTPR